MGEQIVGIDRVALPVLLDFGSVGGSPTLQRWNICDSQVCQKSCLRGRWYWFVWTISALATVADAVWPRRRKELLYVLNY